MFIINLFIILSTLLFHEPRTIPATTLESQKQVKAAATFFKPLHPASVSAKLIFPSPFVKRSFVECIGPDKKHFFTTQEDCEAFTTAWGSPKNPGANNGAWGIAQKIGDHTYTMKFTPDAAMATPQEIFSSLNAYRHVKNVGTLAWSQTLADYASSRALFFAQSKTLDAHAGFLDFVNNQNGFVKLGFSSLGENAAYAGPVSGVHLIEWIFAGDVEHDSNQLSPNWTDVGIGVSDKGVDLIFGGNKR